MVVLPVHLPDWLFAYPVEYLQVVNYPNRNLLYYVDSLGFLWVETVWKQHDGYPHGRLNCYHHPLCGLKFRRPHFTCLTGCRIRRTYTGELQNPLMLKGTLMMRPIHARQRRFWRLKDALLKIVISVAENLLAN